MKIRSRIKTTLNDDLLKSIAAVCDTMRFNSSQHKMLIMQQLLIKYGVSYSMLGGATNRVVMMIDGYTFKFAIDHQGYVDNLVEYAISRELQPYVTKTYETNGYVLVAECVKTMSLSDFKLRESDIKRILSILAQDYLLGDVGYITKNYENWGIRDDGSAVILDYAYCHRATEKLFTCEVCGCGILHYDSTFSYLKCSNTADCTATFNYIDRKRIQGDQIDLDMIEEAKESSIHLPKGVFEKEVTENYGRFFTGKRRIITNYNEYVEYLNKEENKMYNYDNQKALDLMVEKASSHDPARIAEIDEELQHLYDESREGEDIEEVEYHPEDELMGYNEEGVDSEDEEEDEYDPEDYEVTNPMSLDDLIAIGSGKVSVSEVIGELNGESEDQDNSDDTELSTDDLIDKLRSSDTQLVECSVETTTSVTQTAVVEETGNVVTEEEPTTESQEVEQPVSEQATEEPKEPTTIETKDETPEEEAGEVVIDTEALANAMTGGNKDDGGVFYNGERIGEHV